MARVTAMLTTRRADTVVTTPSPPPLRDRLVPPWPAASRWDWGGPLLVAGIAAWIRFMNLGTPHAFVMDETFYAKDGFSLIEHGYEREFVEGANERILAGDLDVFADGPAFVVHPPLGKWLIGAGEWVFGVDPTGWRVATALLGTLTVLLLARITRRLTRSTLLGCIAGFMLALDGLHIALSRTAFLDVLLTFFVLSAFGALLIDRDRMRARAAAWADENPSPDRTERGPAYGWRRWRIAAGVLLGLACGTKWSGLYYLLAFGLLSLVWDWSTRRAVGIRHAFPATARRDLFPASVSLGLVGAVTYVLTWSGWFATTGGYGRDWAAGRDTAFPFIPEAVRSLWHYHELMFNSAAGIHTDHAYQSAPWSWPFMARPVSMHWDDSVTGCGADRCVSAVLGLGNPAVWWLGVAALLFCLWLWIGRRDWRAGAVLLGFAAGWLPWFAFLDRTTFSWYLVVSLPFTIMAITLVFGHVLGPAGASARRRSWGAGIVGAALMLVVVAFVYFVPLWTGETITYSQWLDRMWFARWY